MKPDIMTIEQFNAMIPIKSYEIITPYKLMVIDHWDWDRLGEYFLVLKVSPKASCDAFRSETIAQLNLQGLFATNWRNNCIGIKIPEGKTKSYFFWSPYFKRYFLYFK